MSTVIEQPKPFSLEGIAAIAQNVADRFKPLKVKWANVFTNNKLSKTDTHTQEKPLVGALAALKSLSDEHLVNSYKRLGNMENYLGSDEALAHDLRSLLTEYFQDNRDENIKSGALLQAKVDLFKDSQFREGVDTLGRIPSLPSPVSHTETAQLNLENNKKPIITNLENFTGKFNFDGVTKIWEKANNAVENTNNAASWKNIAGKVAETSGGIAIGIGLKMAFNTVATASGVGLIVAAGYGVTKTAMDEFKQHRKEDASFKEAFKKTLQTDINMDFMKKSLKNTAIFGAGMAIGIGADEEILEKLSPAIEIAKTYTAPFTDKLSELATSVSDNALFKGDWLPALTVPSISWPASWSFGKEDTTASKPQIVLSEPEILPQSPTEVIEKAPEIIAETIPPTPLETLATLTDQNSALVEKALDGNKNAMKEVAYGLLNDKLGFEQNRELGAQLMKQAADMGHLGAIKDVAYLEAHTDLLDVVAPETELAALEVTGQAKDILANAINGQPQAMNDAAIGLLNEKFGFPKDFDLGIEMLANAVELGHDKSLTDMKTLLDHNMATMDMLSSNAQMKLLDQGLISATELTQIAQSQLTERMLSEGAEGVCNITSDSCQFAETTSDERKGTITKLFNGMKSQVQSMANLVSFTQDAKPILVASIK